jgi:hypothetical protein
MSIQTNRAAILAKLNAMQTLKAAYDWETSNSSGNYPFATVTVRAGEGATESSQYNKRMQGFRIRVYQERSKIGQGPEAAEDIAVSVLDELQTAFDMDITLSGVCSYVMPISWDATYVDRELDTRLLEVNVNTVELVSSDP